MIRDVPAAATYLHTSAAGAAGPCEIWSATRLPYEPKGWLVDLRACVSGLVSGLVAEPGHVLHAVYRSNATDSVDTENVLFYNVGLGAFRRATPFGLRFERVHGACPPASDAAAYAHHCRYAIAPASAPFHHWRAGTAIARWEGVRLPPLHEMSPCAPNWLAMRRHGVESAAALPHGRPFGLRVVVRPGAGGAAYAAGFVKPLLDGVVAALHRHDGRDLALLAERLAAQLGAPAAEVAELLASDGPSPLGTRRLIWGRAQGVQWNPGDDACVAAEVLVAERSAGGEWSCSGEVFTVTATGSETRAA
jgi:hypothetical protein